MKQTKDKKHPFNFGSLVVCLLFYFLRELLRRRDVIWDKIIPLAHQIFEHLHNIGDMKARDEAPTTLFTVFYKKMHERQRIPKSLLEKYRDDITFLVKTDECIIEIVELKKIRIQPLSYEINEANVNGFFNLLLNSSKNTTQKRHGTYEEKVLEVHI